MIRASQVGRIVLTNFVLLLVIAPNAAQSSDLKVLSGSVFGI